MVAAVAIAVALGTNKPDLELSTLGIVCRELVASTPYKLEMPKDLDTRPVVFHFEGKTDPLVRLKGMCKNLFVRCYVDEEAKRIDLSRAPALVSTDPSANVQKALSRVAGYLTRFSGWSPEDRGREADRLDTLVEGMADDPVAVAKVRWQTQVLRASSTPAQLILEKALLSSSLSQTAAILSRTCTSTNRLRFKFKPQELDELVAYGRVLHSSDGRPEAAGGRQSIVVVRHWVHETAGIGVNLSLVTPTENQFLGGVTFPCDLSVPAVPAQDKSFNAAIRLSKTYSVLGKDAPVLNDLGGIAVEQQCNYVGWLETGGFGGSLRSAPIEMIQEIMPKLRVTVADGWLRIVDYANPFPEYVCSWEPFVKLRPCVEDAPLTQSALLEKLEGLSAGDLTDLELVRTSYKNSFTTYEGITCGVRLLRAALRQSKSLSKETSVDFDLPIADLSDGAKSDASAFLKGEWVWEYYTHLMHPLNVMRLRRIRLHAKTKEETGKIVLKWGLSFPQDSVPLINRSPIEFELALAIQPD